MARDLVGALRAGMLDALMAAEPSLADQREQVVCMSTALAVGGPLADLDVASLGGRDGSPLHLNLLTLHSAKGLEFPAVFLVGLEEGLSPTTRAMFDDDKLEEERRLCYVGITRAQRSLAVSWTKKRKKGREMVTAQPSRFIKEMDLNKATVREDPREKLKALRAEFAQKAQAAAAQAHQP